MIFFQFNLYKELKCILNEVLLCFYVFYFACEIVLADAGNIFIQISIDPLLTFITDTD